jgi:hypothetical protein
MMLRHEWGTRLCNILWFLTTPTPDSVKKILIFKGLRDGCGAKILSSLDLAAESSQHWSYGPLSTVSCVFVLHCGIRARRGADAKRLPGSISSFNFALREGNFLQEIRGSRLSTESKRIGFPFFDGLMGRPYNRSMKAPEKRPNSLAIVGATMVGVAIGATAVGALAIGAVAIGAIAIGNLAVRKGQIDELTIGNLKVGNLSVEKSSTEGVG